MKSLKMYSYSMLLLALFLLFSFQSTTTTASAAKSSPTSTNTSFKSWLSKLGGGSTKPAIIVNNKKSIDILSDDEEEDQVMQATFIAETSLPTDLGMFRLRAYRIPFSTNNVHVGTEPCVIYAADKPPFDENGNFQKGVPVRVHDQCFTSEVFRSQRYALQLCYCCYK